MSEQDPGPAPSPLPPSDADPRRSNATTTPDLSGQLSLLDLGEPSSTAADFDPLRDAIRFDGPAIEPEDAQRLNSSLRAVRDQLLDGMWHTLAQLAVATGASEAGVSARLRDLRKPRFGGHTIERERVSGGLWRYRLVVR